MSAVFRSVFEGIMEGRGDRAKWQEGWNGDTRGGFRRGWDGRVEGRMGEETEA